MDSLIDTPGIVRPVPTKTGQSLVGAELGEQIFCLGGIALTVLRHLHRPNIQGLGIDGQMDLTPGTAVLGAVLF